MNDIIDIDCGPVIEGGKNHSADGTRRYWSIALKRPVVK
jgi:hypothetical protein